MEVLVLAEAFATTRRLLTLNFPEKGPYYNTLV